MSPPSRSAATSQRERLGTPCPLPLVGIYKAMNPTRLIKSAAHVLGEAYVEHVCASDFRHQQFQRHNERPIEYSFVFGSIARLQPRSVLDVGTGKTALPHLIASCGCVVTAVDNIRDYWPQGMFNRHWHIVNDD